MRGFDLTRMLIDMLYASTGGMLLADVLHCDVWQGALAGLGVLWLSIAVIPNPRRN